MSTHAWFYSPVAHGTAFRHEKASGKIVAIVSAVDNGFSAVDHAGQPERECLYIDQEKALAAVEEEYP